MAAVRPVKLWHAGEYTHDRILAMIMGVAYGDALGAPREFEYNKKDFPFTSRLTHRIRVKSRWKPGEEKFGVLGQVTDDTAMTLAMLRSIICESGYNVNRVIRAYQDWINHKLKPIGRGVNTHNLFGNSGTVKNYLSRREKYSPTQSNGSLMRLWPAILVDDGYGEDSAVVTDCKLTNDTVVNCNASQVMAAAVRTALLGGSKSEVLKAALSVASCDAVLHTLQHALHANGVSPDVPHIPTTAGCTACIQPWQTQGNARKAGKGWVLVSLYTAFYCFSRSSSFREAVEAAIRRGGDTDTNGAITGGLAGAYYGLYRASPGKLHMMSDSIVKENLRVICTADTRGGDYPQPDCYHPGMIPGLVQAFLEKAVRMRPAVTEILPEKRLQPQRRPRSKRQRTT